MLLAIDIGNTHSVFGVKLSGEWKVWRRQTEAGVTEDELVAWLMAMFGLSDLPFAVTSIICASVVPPANEAIIRLGREWLRTEPLFIKTGPELGLDVSYDPPTAVGADRIANALGALDLYKPPIIVVDFGTATTFDTVDGNGTYVGGAILPGIEVSAQALAGKTAKLPQIELRAPERAIGKTTSQSLQSGLVLGYAGAIDHIATLIDEELGGGTTIIATGGLSGMFMGLCRSLLHHEPDLTLEGLRIAHERLTAGTK